MKSGPGAQIPESLAALEKKLLSEYRRIELGLADVKRIAHQMGPASNPHEMFNEFQATIKSIDLTAKFLNKSYLSELTKMQLEPIIKEAFEARQAAWRLTYENALGQLINVFLQCLNVVNEASYSLSIAGKRATEYSN